MRVQNLLFCFFLLFSCCSRSREQQVQWFAEGDSITHGWHGDAGGPVKGTTYPERAQALLNASGGVHVELIQEGYPSKTTAWYLTDTRTFHGVTPIEHTISQFDTVRFKKPIVTLFFGANDLTNQDSSHTDHTPVGVYRYIRQATSRLEKAGATVVVCQTMNRMDSYATPTFNKDQLKLDSLLVQGYPPRNLVKRVPAMHSSAAPANRVLFHDRVHPTEAGDELLGRAFADAVARQLTGR